MVERLPEPQRKLSQNSDDTEERAEAQVVEEGLY
jgi:hypothetical protein